MFPFRCRNQYIKPESLLANGMDPALILVEFKVNSCPNILFLDISTSLALPPQHTLFALDALGNAVSAEM